MIKYLQKSGWAILDQAIISLTNFIISIYLGRRMTSDEYGLYILSFTSLVLCVGFLNNSVSLPINIIGVGKEGSDWNKILSSFVALFMIDVAIYIFIYLILSIIFAEMSHYNMASVFMVLATIILFYCGQEFVRRILMTKLNFRSIFICDIITCISRLLIIYYGFMVVEDMTCRSVLIIFGITSSFGIVYALRVINQNVKDITSFDKKSILQILKISKWTIADWVPFVLYGQFYIFVVAFMLGNTENGILGACKNLVAPIVVLEVGLSTFLLPMLRLNYEKHGIYRLMSTLKKIFLYLLFPVTIYLIVISIYSENILTLLYKKYGEYSYIVILYCISIMINYLFKPADLFMYSIAKPKYIFYSRIITSLPSFVITILFISYSGIVGAVYSIIASNIIMLLTLYYYMRKTYNEMTIMESKII